MRRIPSRGNASTELRLRFALVSAGVRGWKLQAALYGKPDFFFPDARVVVFVDGCFWHGCGECTATPRRNAEFWSIKIKTNQGRDAAVNTTLEQLGFRVLRLWEHTLQQDLRRCVELIAAASAPSTMCHSPVR